MWQNRGGPGRPLSFDELAVKFRDNSGRGLPAPRVAELERCVGRLADLDTMSPLLDLLTDVGSADSQPR